MNEKRRKESQVDRKSDNDYFKRCLENAVGAAPGLPRLHIGWMKMLETDLDCTNPNHPDYQKDCEEKLIWLKSQLAPPPKPVQARPAASGGGVAPSIAPSGSAVRAHLNGR